MKLSNCIKPFIGCLALTAS
uniref:Uncharacterized protein n=1 Tax=Rhizophora mucronata TaxID=61149 RepID=A0A2P2L6A4_RHIMU